MGTADKPKRRVLFVAPAQVAKIQAAMGPTVDVRPHALKPMPLVDGKLPERDARKRRR